MTPDEEPTFIQLWTQGASYTAIAQAMRCALGTVASRLDRKAHPHPCRAPCRA